MTHWAISLSKSSVVAALAIAFLYVGIARSAPIDSADVRVIDGDTIRVYQKRPDVRLVGFNTPANSENGSLRDLPTRRIWPARCCDSTSWILPIVRDGGRYSSREANPNGSPNGDDASIPGPGYARKHLCR